MQMSKVPIISGYAQYSDSEPIGDYSPPEILVHKTSITPGHFIEFHFLIQERERSCMLVRGIYFACVSHYFCFSLFFDWILEMFQQWCDMCKEWCNMSFLHFIYFLILRTHDKDSFSMVE